MNESLLIIGIGMSVVLFAIKAGLGASAGRFGWREMAALTLIYLALFAGVALVCRSQGARIQSIAGRFLQTGVMVHVLMAIGMAIWGWSLLRRRDSGAGVRKGAAWLIVAPCPVCASAIFFSVSLGAMLSAVSPVRVSFILAAVFFVVSIAIYVLSRRLTLGGDALGILCLLVSTYFLTSLAVAPAYAKASEIYALSEQFGHGSDARVRDLLCLAIFTAGIFVSGIWRGVRK